MLQLFLVSVKENDYSIHFCYEFINIMKNFDFTENFGHYIYINGLF